MANISPAAVIGGEFIFNNNHRASLLMRYYSPTYHNLHAIALGQSSTPQNEMGFGCHYQGRLPLGLTATGIADFFYFPHMKYLVYAPSHGQEYRVTLSRPVELVKGLSVNVRYRYKEKGRNITPSTQVDGHYLLEQTYRHQVQGDIEYSTRDWRLVTRIGYAHYHGDETQADKGLLLYQDVQYHPQNIPLTVAARVAWFDVDDYEARLYTVESDFIYQYNSMAYQNEGYRCYLVAVGLLQQVMPVHLRRGGDIPTFLLVAVAHIHRQPLDELHRPRKRHTILLPVAGSIDKVFHVREIEEVGNARSRYA